ncbi:MAG: hypothetical protein OHK0023_27850 [Anaerolineae bacterium]
MRSKLLGMLSVVLLFGLFATKDATPVEARTARQCTRAEAEVLACPDCNDKVLFQYPADTLLHDVNAVDDIWLRLTDTATGKQGFIRALEVQTCDVEDWQTRPVIAQATGRAREIYARGLSLGNNPRTFSIVGDCQAVSEFFLGSFDNPKAYHLGDYGYLQATITHFGGSFSRRNVTVDNGFNVASVFSEIWADPRLCDATETPLDCEYRINKPSIVIISMETIWAGDVAVYEGYLRQIITYWIDKGVVPILSTKADDIEGGHLVNMTIARLASEYDLPLWNFWLAVQPLPNHGLTDDKFHLTFGQSMFNDPKRLKAGWTIRNLTALQSLDSVWRGVQ